MSRKRGEQHKRENSPSRSRTAAPQPATPSAGGTVTVVARSWETLALDVPLRFPVPPPAAEIDGASSYWWKLIEYATDLRDPTTFPPFDHPASPEMLRACHRYTETARDLAASAALNHPVSLEIKIADAGDSEEVLFNPPPADATAGFAVLLRQFYSQRENASFHVLLTLLRAETAESSPPHQAEQRQQLDAWKRAEGEARKRSVQNQAIKRLIADGRAPNDPDLDTYPDVAPPEQTISEYFYGDHVHWDSKADLVDQRRESPFVDAWYRHGFFTAAAGLAHLYVGFAALVDSAVAHQASH